MSLKAVGFDIDGTLYPDSRARMRSVFFFLSHIRVISAFGNTRKLMRERKEDDSEAELKIFAELLGKKPDEAARIRQEIMFDGWERCFRRVKPYRGAAEALEKLKESGLKLAALSDFPVGRKLEYFGLEKYFDTVLGFPESGRLKPNSEPFRLMTDRLGVNPEEILYVGNKLGYDVRGAENAGLRGALIGPEVKRAPEGIMKFRNFRQLADGILSEVSK